MAIRNILMKEDPILRKVSKPVGLINERICELLDDLRETMKVADGVGIAAPQVGILRKVVVIDAGKEYIELINPTIIKCSGKQLEVEGCLSVENLHAKVERPMKMKVQALNRNNELMEYDVEGVLARVFSHELDHLDGILFIDKVVEWANE